MKFRKFKELVNQVDDRFLDCDILVDTDAATFICHMVEITGLWTGTKENFGFDEVYISLDNTVKRHYMRDESNGI